MVVFENREDDDDGLLVNGKITQKIRIPNGKKCLAPEAKRWVE